MTLFHHHTNFGANHQQSTIKVGRFNPGKLGITNNGNNTDVVDENFYLDITGGGDGNHRSSSDKGKGHQEPSSDAIDGKLNESDEHLTFSFYTISIPLLIFTTVFGMKPFRIIHPETSESPPNAPQGGTLGVNQNHSNRRRVHFSFIGFAFVLISMAGFVYNRVQLPFRTLALGRIAFGEAGGIFSEQAMTVFVSMIVELQMLTNLLNGVVKLKRFSRLGISLSTHPIRCTWTVVSVICGTSISLFGFLAGALWIAIQGVPMLYPNGTIAGQVWAGWGFTQSLYMGSIVSNVYFVFICFYAGRVFDDARHRMVVVDQTNGRSYLVRGVQTKNPGSKKISKEQKEEGQQQQKAGVLAEYKRAYFDLTQLIVSINDCYAYPLILNVAAEIVVICFAVYYFVGSKHIEAGGYTVPASNQTAFLLESLLSEFLLFNLTIMAAIYLNEKSREIKDHLMTIDPECLLGHATLERFMTKCDDRNWGITLGNFFLIERGAYLSLISAIVTFMVMWIQFGQSDTSTSSATATVPTVSCTCFCNGTTNNNNNTFGTLHNNNRSIN